MTETPRTADRCQFRAGWCEKPVGHDGDHYTTYRPGETWTWDAPEAAQDAARQWDELREALSEVVQAMDTRPNPGGICTWTAAEHAAVGKAHRLLRATEGKQPCPNHRIEGVSPFCPDCGMTA